MAKAKKDNELRLVRVFDAPVKLVWEAWTEDKHVSKWYGPRGFTYTTKSKEICPGGRWVFTMHGPDGVDYPNITTYHEVEKYKRLVYDHGANEERGALFRVTVTFEEFKGKTVMDMTMSLATPEAAQEAKKFIKQASGDSTWDRLGEHLEEIQTKRDIFIINRSFEADIQTVFEMWVNPKHFAQWMGPTGSSMVLLQSDVKEGGKLHYEMTMGESAPMYGMVNYQKISPYQLLIYTQNFCDKEGMLTKPPFAPTWPDRMLSTITFAEEGPHETRVTVKWEVYGDATEIERQTFHKEKSGMTQGWAGSFDKLELLLTSSL